ncbi:hypothetical protein M9H77_30089 [Catharanthus roseus]|uniref:Uncharacterized protein n=1 Tax=Catharanthus roseus TaxID=4058 RepID=A0ACB9ZW93_CATRO|nr:hypothetical protein M9H77_30089 [Catharanthus roseus]
MEDVLKSVLFMALAPCCCIYFVMNSRSSPYRCIDPLEFSTKKAEKQDIRHIFHLTVADQEYCSTGLTEVAGEELTDQGKFIVAPIVTIKGILLIFLEQQGNRGSGGNQSSYAANIVSGGGQEENIIFDLGSGNGVNMNQEQTHAPSINPAMPGFTGEQYERLMYLLNNTQIANNSAGGIHQSNPPSMNVVILNSTSTATDIREPSWILRDYINIIEANETK